MEINKYTLRGLNIQKEEAIDTGGSVDQAADPRCWLAPEVKGAN